MTEHIISLTEHEKQRMEMVLLDREKEEALKFLREGKKLPLEWWRIEPHRQSSWSSG